MDNQTCTVWLASEYTNHYNTATPATVQKILKSSLASENSSTRILRLLSFYWSWSAKKISRCCTEKLREIGTKWFTKMCLRKLVQLFERRTLLGLEILFWKKKKNCKKRRDLVHVDVTYSRWDKALITELWRKNEHDSALLFGCKTKTNIPEWLAKSTDHISYRQGTYGKICKVSYPGQ